MDLKELDTTVTLLLKSYPPGTPVVVDWDGDTGILGGVETDPGPTIVLFVDGLRRIRYTNADPETMELPVLPVA